MPRRSKKLSKGSNNKGIIGVPDEDELRHLEKVILGTGSEVFQTLNSEAEEEEEEDSDEEPSAKSRKVEEVEEKKPAWVDEDDDVTFQEVVEKQQRRCKILTSGAKKYQTIMENKYQEVMGVPKWSKQTKKDQTPADNLLNRCGNLIKKPEFLKKDSLQFKKLRHLNYETYTEGQTINVIKFHSKSTVAMVAGTSGVVSLFQVNGKHNPKLHSIQFQKFPIHCGSFLRDGEELLVGSQYYRYFYSYNLVKGNIMRIDNYKIVNLMKTNKFCVSPNDDLIAVCADSGRILLLTTATKEYIHTFQMNCSAITVDFNHDGSLLYSHGSDGEVYIWDVKSRTCIKKFFDDGCITGTAIATSKNDQFLACGSSSGVVNIYNRETIDSTNTPLPVKMVYNLVTRISSCQFNSTSEILSIASYSKENALKLIHCPSMTVFSNFPEFQSKIKKPACVDFSPNSGYFAVGDTGGIAHLFRLKYYGNY